MSDRAPAVVTLDHVLLGAAGLTAGCDLVAERTGVRPALGGEHPKWGSHNALLALGPASYLELVALRPEAPASGPFGGLRQLAAPAAIGWCAATTDAEATRAQLTTAGFSLTPVVAGGRARPDGTSLAWKTFSFEDRPFLGPAPFFIEWAAGCPHPAMDAPPGCRLSRLTLRAPEAEWLAWLCALLDLGPTIVAAPQPVIEFTLDTPFGRVKFGG